MLRQTIIAEYQATVALANIDSELKRALKYNERVPAFIDRLEEQLRMLEPRFLTEFYVRQCTQELTHFFLRNVKQHCDERMLSDAAKQAMLNQEIKRQKQEQIVDDMNEGKEIDAERIAEVADE